MNLKCSNMEAKGTLGRRPRLNSMAIAMTIAALVGCGEAKPERVAVHPASGTLTVKGQPAPGAFVTLHPKAEVGEDVPPPRANVDKDGTFKLSTFAGGDGAPEGEYTVTIRWYKLIKNGTDVSQGPNVIPAKYTKPESSNLTVRIAAGQNSLPPIKL
jgi:hypothetical protein